jgi:hypothetical protein
MFPGFAVLGGAITGLVLFKSRHKKTSSMLQSNIDEFTKILNEARDAGYKQLAAISPRFSQSLVYRMCESFYPMIEFDDVVYTSLYDSP